jgi:hypothetical protein
MADVFPVVADKEPFPPNLTWGGKGPIIYPLIIAKEPYKDPLKDIMYYWLSHQKELKVKNG